PVRQRDTHQPHLRPLPDRKNPNKTQRKRPNHFGNDRWHSFRHTRLLERECRRSSDLAAIPSRTTTAATAVRWREDEARSLEEHEDARRPPCDLASSYAGSASPSQNNQKNI